MDYSITIKKVDNGFIVTQNDYNSDDENARAEIVFECREERMRSSHWLSRDLECMKNLLWHIIDYFEYWQKKADCKFGFLVWLKDVRAIEPVRIHKTDWRAWVVLTEKENFGLLKTGGTIKHNK